MTKLEFLLQSTPNRVRDTWAVYGSTVFGPAQTEFAKDSIFQLQGTGTIWDNALFFVTEDIHLSSPFNWVDYTFDDETKGTIKNNNAIIHPSLYCVLSATKFTAITDPVDLSFVAFAALDTVEISDEQLNMILLEAGVPFITLQEIEYNRDTILNLMVKPAIEEYYRWFPLIEIIGKPITNSIEIPLPPHIKHVLYAYVIPGFVTSQYDIKNPINRYYDEVVLNTQVGGAFSAPYQMMGRRQGFADVTGLTTHIMGRALRQGIINYGNRTRLRYDIVNRVLKGYSNTRGIAEVVGAIVSYKWEHIPYTRQREVRELATAKVLRSLGALRTLSSDKLQGNLNGDKYIERATELEKNIIEKWSSETNTLFIRS